jgi:hypothetical protein
MLFTYQPIIGDKLPVETLLRDQGFEGLDVLLA